MGRLKIRWELTLILRIIGDQTTERDQSLMKRSPPGVDSGANRDESMHKNKVSVTRE